MTRSRLAVGVALVGLLPLVGCTSRILRETFGVVKGASGEVTEISPPSNLGEYGNVVVESIGGAGGPAGLGSMIQRQMQRTLSRPGGGSRTLRLRGEIVHYEGSDTKEKGLGPLEEVIVRATLVNDSGAQLGQANLVGRAKAVTSGGKENLAEGAAKAAEKWLKKHGWR